MNEIKKSLLTFDAKLENGKSFREQSCEDVPNNNIAPNGIEIFQSTTKLKGIAIVAHGLNTKPAKMDSLVHFLQEQGLRVIRISFSGHRGLSEDSSVMGNLRSDLWLKEAFLAYCFAKKEANGLPIYYFGYSLGGLIGEDLLNQNLKEKIELKKVVLFSPAIATRDVVSLIKLAAPLGRGLKIPSHSPEAYQANSSTSIAAYLSLFHMKRDLKKSEMKASNIPTLILIDPKDELVSERKINKIKTKQNLDQWKIEEISNSGSTLEKSYHHLVIDEDAVGKDQWEKMKNSIEGFLKE